MNDHLGHPSCPSRAVISGKIRNLIRLRIWLADRFRFGELQLTLVWAVVIGLVGAWTSIGFREATEWLHSLFTGHRESYIESFRAMPPWQRLAVPTLGGLLAGSALLMGRRYRAAPNSTDYMEAVVVGEGDISFKVSMVKSLSAWFSSASGASIGREGPLVQLSSLAASLLARFFAFPLARKRLLVACGAAAGIASAYNAPIAGAFFVAEIVLGSMAIEAFGPLVTSSVVATLVTRSIYGSAALYAAPAFHFASGAVLLPFLLLGLAIGLLVPWFLWLLKAAENSFSRLKLPPPFRLALGGLIVGGLAVYHPEVAGNGRALVAALLHEHQPWHFIALILICKLVATAATFGSGAVGGVFTPTLFVGAAAGYLWGLAAAAFFPTAPPDPTAFALVGMGAFLTAATGAPVMAIIMIFELTLNYEILIPALLASLMAYFVSRTLGAVPIYSEALRRKGGAAVAQHLATFKIGDLTEMDTLVLGPKTSFGEVAKAFLQSRHDSLNIVEAGHLLGTILLHDIKAYLDEPGLEGVLIARDLIQDPILRLKSDETITVALDLFQTTDVERLPVIGSDNRFLGSVTQAGILLFLAGRPRPVVTAREITG